jgi:hypothetical protein
MGSACYQETTSLSWSRTASRLYGPTESGVPARRLCPGRRLFGLLLVS